MDERLAALDARVAAAADAWLTDPRDAGVYARLVQAIENRRAYLNPPLDVDAVERDDSGPTPVEEQDDELLDELAADSAEPRPIADLLRGSAGAVLANLRAESHTD